MIKENQVKLTEEIIETAYKLLLTFPFEEP